VTKGGSATRTRKDDFRGRKTSKFCDIKKDFQHTLTFGEIIVGRELILQAYNIPGVRRHQISRQPLPRSSQFSGRRTNAHLGDQMVQGGSQVFPHSHSGQGLRYPLAGLSHRGELYTAIWTEEEKLGACLVQGGLETEVSQVINQSSQVLNQSSHSGQGLRHPLAGLGHRGELYTAVWTGEAVHCRLETEVKLLINQVQY
jgi:hypothetical protein